MGDDVGEVGEARRLAKGRHHSIHEASHRHHQKQRQEARVQHQQGVHGRGRLGLQGARRRVPRSSFRVRSCGPGGGGRARTTGRDAGSDFFRILLTSRVTRPTCGGAKTLSSLEVSNVYFVLSVISTLGLGCSFYRDSCRGV